MTNENTPQEKNIPAITEEEGLGSKAADSMMNWFVNAINEVDEKAASERVVKLKEKHPEATQDELADMLIKHKCLQTGAVGVATSAPSLLPGLGTVMTWTFGVAADIGMTFKLQAELVLEIADLYDRTLTADEKRNTVILVTGLGAGTAKVAERVGKEVAKEAAERLAKRSVAKAVPVLGVATSAGINITSTYLMGHRAKAYFALPRDKRDEWDENLRALTGIDERDIATWLTESVQNVWELTKESVGSLSNALVGVGRVTGEFAVSASENTNDAFKRIRSKVVDVFQKRGEQDVIIKEELSDDQNANKLSLWRRLWGADEKEEEEIEIIPIEMEEDTKKRRIDTFLKRSKDEVPPTYEIIDWSERDSSDSTA